MTTIPDLDLRRQMFRAAMAQAAASVSALRRTVQHPEAVTELNAIDNALQQAESACGLEGLPNDMATALAMVLGVAEKLMERRATYLADLLNAASVCIAEWVTAHSGTDGQLAEHNRAGMSHETKAALVSEWLQQYGVEHTMSMDAQPKGAR